MHLYGYQDPDEEELLSHSVLEHRSFRHWQWDDHEHAMDYANNTLCWQFNQF